PTDRAVDGIDQSAFLLGKTEKSAREFIPVFQGNIGGSELYAMKWRKWKMHFFWQERKYDPPQKLAIPRLIDLYVNPQERIEETIGESSIEGRGWIAHAMFGELAKFMASLKKDPPVPMGTSDPYAPGAGK
ncbi:MAG: arylsulfatase, partial [Candidatus Methylomirabilales bacterium]